MIGPRPAIRGQQNTADLGLIDEYHSQALEWLSALVAVDSESPHEQAAQQLVAQIAGSQGLDVQLFDADHDGLLPQHPRFVETGMSYENRQNCIVRMPGRTAPPLVCNAHIDTVAIGDGWSRDPSGEFSGNRFYGRGSCDTKASLVAALLAAICLDRTPTDVAFAPIEIHSVVDEEPGGNGTLGMLRALQSNSQFVRPALVVVMEPTRLDVVMGHRGMLWYRLECVGVQAHGSTSLGVNAVELAADVVRALRELNTRLAKWPTSAYAPPRLNVGIINGGHEVYTTPGRCTLDVSVRYEPGQRDDVASAVLDAVTSVLTPSQLEIAFCRDFEASQTPAGSPELLAALRAVRRHRPDAQLSTLGGTCDMRHYRTEWQVPAIVFGPGDLAVAHMADEFVDIDEMFAAARMLVDLALSLG
jgi:acetylornithine deacetylase/succinyl-diaminopimelate desuccinylase-like protein